MNNKPLKALGTGILIFIALLSYTCTDTNPNNFSVESRACSVSWVEVKTGLTDSLKEPEATTSEEEFAAHLNKAGFKISWERVDDVDYYEVRASKGRISNANWEKSTLVAKVPNSGSTIITATVDMIQPSITGRNCTGCQSCVGSCPRHAITIFKGKAVIDLDSCIGCSRCYDVCTYNAVSDENLTQFYFFGVRGYNNNSKPVDNVICTDYAYKSRYANNEEIESDIIPGLMFPWCGKCGAGCYILDPTVSPKGNVEFGGCPVDAIYYDSTNMMYVDQAKCISCGLCVEECGYNGGHWSIRREVISSE